MILLAGSIAFSRTSENGSEEAPRAIIPIDKGEEAPYDGFFLTREGAEMFYKALEERKLYREGYELEKELRLEAEDEVIALTEGVEKERQQAIKNLYLAGALGFTGGVLLTFLFSAVGGL